MPKRLSERYDVDGIRVARGELRPWPNTGKVPLSDLIDSVVPGGSVYHILADVPDDTGIDLTILIDGQTVVYFELPWITERSFFGKRKNTYLAGGSPCDIEVWTLDDYRRRLRQGKYRILVDHAVADARRFLERNGT